jgi:alanine-glyoxylate transaminase/serine-glyoxylate transaminase/serine-pyruvate transaminase
MSERPLLMIPGPIEVSPRVLNAMGGPPPGHVAANVIEAFGRALVAMRKVWLAGDDAQPFVVSGSGTTAMEMAASNLLDEGDRVLVVNIGYFGERIAEMARRRGAVIDEVSTPVGATPDLDAVEAKLKDGDYKVVFCTHVDTSTGVRTDVERVARAAQASDTLSVVDGVCSVAGERLEMQAWGADVVLTGSQKAIGLPPGLGMLVASPRALRAREALKQPPALVLDFLSWLPIMKAYEEGRPSYFATPATNLLLALDVGLTEILEDGMPLRFKLHATRAAAFRVAFDVLGLSLVAEDSAIAANTLSAVRLPQKVDAAAFIGGVKQRGVIIAGGLHPSLKGHSFRVGHMGYVLTRPAELARTIRAIGESLNEQGHEAPVTDAIEALSSRCRA